MQQSTTKKWDEDALVVSPRGGGATAHLAAKAPQLQGWQQGSNDDYKVEMTATMKTTAAASVGSNVGTDAAALLRQWLMTRGKRSQR